MSGKKYGLSAHVFRRDLRVDDNPSLIYALKNSERVITCFAAEDNLLTGKKNPIYCVRRHSFYMESLAELSAEISRRGGRLAFSLGGARSLAEDLCKSGVETLFSDRDYTPYAKRRDAVVRKVCKDAGVDYVTIPGSLLNEPGDVKKKDGTNYTVFTPYFRKASDIPVRSPEACVQKNFSGEEFIEDEVLPGPGGIKEDSGAAFKGGRAAGLASLGSIEKLSDYDGKRDYLSKDMTAMISAHLRFGTISPREAYHAVFVCFGHGHGLIKQLYWRDFFTHIGSLHPRVFTGSFHERYNSLRWQGDEKLFSLWCKGKTGFPLVDAGMREMNETGYMHNRVRMVTASFLVKDLHIDWMKGERYFASRLTDYDPAVNNGNWQWCASTGCDAQPFFRIFNPWLQQKKFDPDCSYIKKWVPELLDMPSATIHSIYQVKGLNPGGYPAPIVDHATEAKTAKFLYSQVS